nr:RecName: Full=Snaclec aspercetin subunit beta [Bothrops asper]
DCPSDWSSYEGHCYRVFKPPKDWADAERFCSQQAKGGHLVSIERFGREDFVSNLITKNLQRG